jgi:hypothetical protein
VELALGIFALAWVVALALRRGEARAERIWLGLAFGGLLLSTLFRCRYVLPDLCHAGYGSRYFFPLQLILIWLLLCAASAPRSWTSRAAAAVAVLCLLTNLPRLHENSYDDLHWADYAPAIRQGHAVTVPINPAPWKIELPERKLRPPGVELPQRLVANLAVLANVSTRTLLVPGGVLNAGFVIGGTVPRRVLIRAVGPTLGKFGLPAVLERPMLRVTSTDNAVLSTTGAWSGDAKLSALFAAVGAFELPKGSQDAAVVLTLAPGTYTAVVTGADAHKGGEVLIEVYVVD